jgi:UDP-N-acetylmuramoylalanine--D-glutamate ligase
MFSGQKVLVIGIGKSGLASAAALLNHGAQVTAYDENANAHWPLNSPLSDRHLELHVGSFPKEFPPADAIVVSPGIPLAQEVFEHARASGTPVFGEIELAFRLLPPGAGPLLGITGTNGKSTTTALLGEMVRHQFPNTFVGGNLGTAFTSAFEIPGSAPFDFHVIELSSFQLEGLIDAAFFGAAILNLTADHIDRYPSLEAYGNAKANIFSRQPTSGFAVLNADNAHCQRLSKLAHVPVSFFSSTSVSSQASLGGAQELVSRGVSFSVHNRALRGIHNLENAMAAVLMAQQAGVDVASIQRGLDSYPGLSHRFEFVREIRGVEWINDSKATNVDSALVALNASEKNVWLILGGKGKGAPYEPLVHAGAAKIRGVLTIGADAPAIAAAFQATHPVYACETLEVAVKKAATLSSPGDTVLLSPACASYDQFKNFEHRGDTFKVLVKELSPHGR